MSAVQVFDVTEGKEEIASNEQFLPFPSVVSTLLEDFPPFTSNSKLLSTSSLSLEESKICCLGKSYSITCIQRPLKGSNKSGLLQQVVFECRFHLVD